MSLIRGRGGKCPCPVCLVPLEELHDLSKTYPLRSVEEAQEALRVYKFSKAQGEAILKSLGLRPVEVLIHHDYISMVHDTEIKLFRTFFGLSHIQIHTMHSV